MQRTPGFFLSYSWFRSVFKIQFKTWTIENLTLRLLWQICFILVIITVSIKDSEKTQCQFMVSLHIINRYLKFFSCWYPGWITKNSMALCYPLPIFFFMPYSPGHKIPTLLLWNWLYKFGQTRGAQKSRIVMSFSTNGYLRHISFLTHFLLQIKWILCQCNITLKTHCIYVFWILWM